MTAWVGAETCDRPLSEPVGANQEYRSAGLGREVVYYFYYQTCQPTGKRNYYPLPPRDSQGRQTAARMRLGGNQKAKPSRGEGRERTGGRAATEPQPQTRCWRGPKEADHGATEPRLCSPWLGGPHTPSSVKQFKIQKQKKSGRWPPHAAPAASSAQCAWWCGSACARGSSCSGEQPGRGGGVRSGCAACCIL
jgi:hypothetical protein